MAKKRLRFHPALLVLAALPLTLPLISAPAAAGDRDHLPDFFKPDHRPSNTPARVRTLSGKYGWTTQQVCVRTMPGAPGLDAIDPNPPNALNVPGEIVSMSGTGTGTFKRDGTLILDGWADELRHGKTAAGDTPLSGGFSPICEGTYSIAPDNRIQVDWDCRIDFDAQPGLAIQAGPVNWDGFVTEGGNSVDLNLKGTVQRLTFLMNEAPVQEVQRLCVQRFMLHKLPK